MTEKLSFINKADQLLQRYIGAITGMAPQDVHFERPGSNAKLNLKKDTIRVHLISVSKNTSNGVSSPYTYRQDEEGQYRKSPKPISVDLIYMSSVHAKSIAREHSILGTLSQRLMNCCLIPDNFIKDAYLSDVSLSLIEEIWEQKNIHNFITPERPHLFLKLTLAIVSDNREIQVPRIDDMTLDIKEKQPDVSRDIGQGEVSQGEVKQENGYSAQTRRKSLPSWFKRMTGWG